MISGVNSEVKTTLALFKDYFLSAFDVRSWDSALNHWTMTGEVRDAKGMLLQSNSFTIGLVKGQNCEMQLENIIIL